MTQLSPQYLAGFFDGEGCVHINKLKRYGHYNYRLTVMFSQATKQVVDMIHQQFGGSFYHEERITIGGFHSEAWRITMQSGACLLYTSDAADERSSVDLGGRRI